MAESTEQAFPSTAISIGGGRVITTPFQFVADADTFLRVVSNCSVAGVTLAIQGRRLDEHGQIQPIIETHAPASTRTTRTQDYFLGVGAVLNLTVFAAAGAPLAGQCYVMVQLLRNTGGTALVLGTLLGGYVTAVQALGFPGSPVVSSLEGEPAIRSIDGTNPAAGATVSEIVPTGARWQVLSFLVGLTTSAVAGARRLTLDFFTGGFGRAQTLSLDTQPAATFLFHTFAIGVEGRIDLAAGINQVAMPNLMILQAGGAIQVTHTNFDPGDNYDAPHYQVREWLEVI